MLAYFLIEQTPGQKVVLKIVRNFPYSSAQKVENFSTVPRSSTKRARGFSGMRPTF
jgi:hypothetical protein